MKITMYELLGMVKDGKAPKEIIYNGYNYLYHTDRKSYYRSVVGSNWIALTTDFSICTILNNEVEILEEEKKKPEKIKIEQDTPSSNYYIRNENGTKCALTKHSKMIIETLNQLIDYFKSKGDE